MPSTVVLQFSYTLRLDGYRKTEVGALSLRQTVIPPERTTPVVILVPRLPLNSSL
jgi:hypothetical protein